ncbi:MAG: ribose-phosphate diphosphokinase [Streptococcaceae bacterium]|jgi:ribose-phosphate pyrophosphokinase|nr:ribose-phosphate diphosphokinase [Streptococcaceae bacterium]
MSIIKYPDTQLKIFSLNANESLAEKVSEAAGVDLGKISSRQFSDGEIQINIEESVRGKDIYIIQATNYPVNDHLMEMLIMVDACKRASAKTVNLVMPYFGYARQDRTAAPREPITAKLVANMIQKAGATRLLTLDLHTVQVQGFFDIPVDNLFTIPLFAEYYRSKGLMGDDVVVVSPKNSGVKRARSLAEYLEAPIAIIDHEEDDKGREFGYVIGDVKGKKAIIVDDIINKGITQYFGSLVLEQAGAAEIYTAASHGLFTENAKELLDRSPIKEIVVTDSVCVPEENLPERLLHVSANELLAHGIINIHENKPISPLFQYDKSEE